MHAPLKMLLPLSALVLAAATLGGCVVEPAPYYDGAYYQPAPAYYGPTYYYGPRYGYWHGDRWHGDRWHGGHHHWH